MVSETKAPTGYIKDETPKNIVVRSGVATEGQLLRLSCLDENVLRGSV